MIKSKNYWLSSSLNGKGQRTGSFFPQPNNVTKSILKISSNARMPILFSWFLRLKAIPPSFIRLKKKAALFLTHSFVSHVIINELNCFLLLFENIYACGLIIEIHSPESKRTNSIMQKSKVRIANETKWRHRKDEKNHRK